MLFSSGGEKHWEGMKRFVHPKYVKYLIYYFVLIMTHNNIIIVTCVASFISISSKTEKKIYFFFIVIALMSVGEGELLFYVGYAQTPR